jgi:hypothetical protein
MVFYDQVLAGIGNFIRKLKYKILFSPERRGRVEVYQKMKSLALLLVLSVLTNPLLKGDGPSRSFEGPEFCLDPKGYQLYLLINEFRNEHGLTGLPLSRSLCYVADVHARDLTYNHPDKAPCSFHSWSSGGRWTPCCFTKTNPDFLCMWNKPKELTVYKSKGYEIIYWENTIIDPERVIALWKTQPSFKEMILNQDVWSKKTWRTIGITVFEGFAIVWLGEELDPAGEPFLCDEMEKIAKDSVHKTGTNPLPSYMSEVRYYLIAGSYGSTEIANQVAGEFRLKGFPNAKAVIRDNKYRVSLNDFETFSQAQKAKATLGESYSYVWILEQ